MQRYKTEILRILFLLKAKMLFQLSEMSGIVTENIEIAKALGSFPCDVSLLTVNTELEWIAGPTTLNEWPFNIYEDGHVILYR